MSPRWRRLLLLVAGAAGVLVLLVGALLASLPSAVDLPHVQDLLRSEASRLLDRPVRFERVALSYWPLPAVRVRGLIVANAVGFGSEPLLAVEEARVRVRLLPLLAGRVQFGEVTLTRPRVVVEQRRDGVWNLPAPGGARPTPAVPLVLVSRVRLQDGRVEIRVPADLGQPAMAHLVDRIDVTLDDLGWSQPITFKLTARLPGGGITATLHGTIGPLAQAGGDLAGVPARIEARFTAEEAHAAGAAALFVVSGKGDGRVRVEGTLGNMSGGGQLSFARLTVAHRPGNCPAGTVRSLVLEHVELPVRIQGPEVTLRPFGLRVAGGSVQGEATLSWRGATPSVRLSGVRVAGVATEPLLVEFLCQPYAVAGRAQGSGELSVSGVGDALLRSARGTWEVRVGPGRLVGPAMLRLLAGVVRVGAAVSSVVNLDVPRAVLASPLDFQSLDAAGTIGGGLLGVREVALVSRELRVTGAGTYGLVDTRLDFRMRVQTGRSAFAVRIGGTAREPSYAPAGGDVFRGVVDALSPFLGSRRRERGSPPAPPGAAREIR